MQIIVSDNQIVGETEATLFEFLNQGATLAQIVLTNTGSNTLNYRFQQYSAQDQEWQDLVADVDDIFYGTIMAGLSKAMTVDVTNPQVRLVGNASGSTSLWFTVQRTATRASGGKLPILNF